MKTIDQQIRAMSIQWPGFKLTDQEERGATWEGTLAPDKRPHLVRVRYRVPLVIENFTSHRIQPQVEVLNPVLEQHPDYEEGPIPHVYWREHKPKFPFLCLFSPELCEWSADDLIAHTTIFWANEWLLFYEGWLVTKKWHGGGVTYREPIREESDLNQRRSSGTQQDLRKPLPWPEGRPFRILSIDGGGIRGILPASVLTELEHRYLDGGSCGGYFDMIAGTSTGGIIALGLSLGLPAKTILDLYLKHGAEVFPALRWDVWNLRKKWRYLRGIRHYAYEPDKLSELLTAIFERRKLGEAVRRLNIPSFDGFTEVNIFKTPHHPAYRLDWKEGMVTVARATAAAPSYFPIYRDRGRYYADGGVWANNPVMIALVDALACYQLERRQVHILSLGTGDTEIQFSNDQILKGGLWQWRDIMSSAMHLQSQNATGQAGLLIGRDQLIRLNAPPMPQNPIELDDYARASTELPEIAARLIDDNGDLIRDRFFFGPADEYQAFYGPRAPQETV